MSLAGSTCREAPSVYAGLSRALQRLIFQRGITWFLSKPLGFFGSHGCKSQIFPSPFTSTSKQGLAHKALAKEQLELSTWWGVSWVRGAALIALVLRLALLLPTPPPSVTATVALRVWRRPHLIVHLTSHHRLLLIMPKEGTLADHTLIPG